MSFSIVSLYRDYGVDTGGGLVLFGIAFIMLVVSLVIVLAEPRVPPRYRIPTLRIRPIKSCRGIELDRVKLLRTGLRLDRRWMFVDAKGLFITIRQNPRMTLIQTAILNADKEGEEKLQVKVDGTDIDFTIATFPTEDWLAKNTTKETVTIWSTK